MKQYFLFINDHTMSMRGAVAEAARKDLNTLVKTIKDAATHEQLDSIVSVIGMGLSSNTSFNYIRREAVISNPHVLRERENWPTPGGCSPLWDAIYEGVTLHEGLPDINDPGVSVCVFITTDGDENTSKISLEAIAKLIQAKQKLGTWTFVARVPKGVGRNKLKELGIHEGNVQEWSTTAAGMEASTIATTQAVQSFMRSKASGANASSSFYTTAANVNTAALNDVSKSVSLYTVGQKPDDFDGMQIKDFILARRQQYYIGAAFYQLMKLEARVTPTKLILIREKDTGKVYAGAEARKMIGLDTVNNARLHPQHGGSNIDIFIQSESVNRKLGMGHSVLYWQEKGRPMTQDDIDKYAAKPAVPVVPALAEAPAPGQSTKSTIPVTKMLKIDLNTVQGKPVLWYPSRQAARDSHAFGVKDGNSFKAGGPAGQRWFVFA